MIVRQLTPAPPTNKFILSIECIHTTDRQWEHVAAAAARHDVCAKERMRITMSSGNCITHLVGNGDVGMVFFLNSGGHLGKAELAQKFLEIYCDVMRRS